MDEIRLDERRQAPRVPVSLPIKIQIVGEDAKQDFIAKNVSSSGLFVETTSPIALHTAVIVWFHVQSLDVDVETRGVVVRSQPKSFGRKSPAGMAIQFNEDEVISRRLIRRLEETP